MLDLNPETVCWIITKAHEFHAKEGVVISETAVDSGDDWGSQMLADQPSDLTQAEMRSTIEDLEPDQQASLVALMWLGRGDYDAQEWERAVRDASDSWTPRTADYLISTPLVADYLAEGLSLLGYSCSE